MSDRSVFTALSFFVVIVVGLSFYPGNAALAAEQDNGNPGQFIDNIRKGISGLSRYFWSPKAQMQGESAKQPAMGDKTIAPVTKLPEADTKKAAKAKDVKPGQVIKPDNKMARIPVSPKTGFESKTVVDHKNKLAAPKKAGVVVLKTQSKAKPALKVVKPTKQASGSPLKAHTQPSPQSPAIAKAQKKSARRPATEKFSSLVTPRPILKNEPASVKPAKPASPLTSAGRKAKDHKPVGLAKQKTAQKQMTKKSAAINAPSNVSSRAISVQPKTPLVKKAPAALIVAATTKPSKQQLVANDKGTYIWVPNNGSELSQRFGLTGIPAKQLYAKGDLNRKDGRWAFAPKKRGILPSIYGLSAEIQAAGDAGVWVGGGANWVYVFDKNRNYGSIVGGGKAKKKAASKSGKAVASLKSGSLKPGLAAAQKPAIANNADKPAKAQINKAAKKPAKSQNGIEIKKAGKKLAQAPRQQAVIKPLTKRVGQAKAGPKLARNGKWSRVNNRWVFVPQSQPGRMNGAIMKGLAEQVAKAPVTGGWVQRQNRWVYVAPQQGKSGSAANGPTRVQKGIVRNSTITATPKAKNKDLGKAPNSAKIKTVHKPIAKMTPKSGAATGLAEGPDASERKTTKNQKIWVRKNNKWVYVFATPAAKTQQAMQAKRGRLASSNSAQRNASGQSQGMQAGKKPLGEFMFFVPGRTPGKGSWFVAPLQMLEKAKKIKRPLFTGGQ